MDWAGPSVLPQKRQAKITTHYITYVILRGLGWALGPSAKATSKDYRALHYVRDTPWTGPGPRSFRKSDNSNCQKTVRTSCPTLRVMYELPINIPVSYTSLGLHVLHAGYTSEVGYGRVGELALLTLTGDSSFPRRPSKLAFTTRTSQSPPATKTSY